MDISFRDITKLSVAILVAWLESISVVVFVWGSLYLSSPISCWLCILSVFYLSVLGAYRNTEKIDTFWMKKKRTGNMLFNVMFCSFPALLGFLTKRFVLFVYFSQTLPLQILAMTLTFVYSWYIFLNTLADLDRLSAFFVYPREKLFGVLEVFQKGPEGLLYMMLCYATIITCHYKLMALSISIASLANQYGGLYHLLHYTKRLFHFPIIGVGLYNVSRCAQEIKSLSNRVQKSVRWVDVFFLSVVSLASYTQGVSSKLLALSSENIFPYIVVDRFSNYIRQSSAFHERVGKGFSRGL